MARFGLVGPSYPSESKVTDHQTSMNWFPGLVESGDGQSMMALNPTPGVSKFASVPQGPVRGMYYSVTPTGNHCYVAAGNGVYSVLADKSVTLIGNLSNSGPYPVQMEVNNISQLLICDGVNLYLYYISGTPLYPQATINGIQVSVGEIIVQFNTTTIPFSVGDRVTFSGLTGLTQLNNQTASYLGLDGSDPTGATGIFGNPIYTQVSNYPMTSETGTAIDYPAGKVFAQVAQNLSVQFRQIAYLDGYFIGLQANSQTIWISNDELHGGGETWNATWYNTVDVFPDNIMGMIQDHELITLLGVKESCVYYDAGLPLSPFAMVEGTTIDQGAAMSPNGDNFSMVRLDNSVMWLGASEHGQTIAWRLNGYTPQRISNHAVEVTWKQYPNGGADAIGFASVYNGHTFWYLYFPSAGQTWVYDASMQMWHQEGIYDPSSGTYGAWDARCQCFAYGLQLFGSTQGNSTTASTIWVSDVKYYTDGSGKNIRRMRRAPHVSQEQEWMFHHKLRILVEPGLQPLIPLPGVGDGVVQLAFLDPVGNYWMANITDAGAWETQNYGPYNPTAYYPVPLTTLKFLDIGLMGNPLYPPPPGQQAAQVYLLGVDLSGNVVVTQPVPPALPYVTGYVLRQPLMTYPSGLQTSISVQYGNLIIDPVQAPIRNPQMMIRYSDDHAHTWSSVYTCSSGALGEYKHRIEWRRLGRSRDRIYELSCSDPVPWVVTDAYLYATPGYEPQQRYVHLIGKMQ